jgi:ABC-type sugar transport system ATPase subunit
MRGGEEPRVRVKAARGQEIMNMDQTPLLEMRGIRKVFPGVVALNNVDFDLYPGEVHALVGENGAGKSTLIKIISGLYLRDAGTMLVEGALADFRSPADAIARRIKVVYQELDLVPTLSVAENVYLGSYPRMRYGNVDWRTLYAQTAELLHGLGLDVDPRTPVGQLRVAEQQLVEIARALSRQAHIIVMDEPTSALSPAEVEKLFGAISCLKEAHCGVIYVSHKLEEIYQVADRVTVFRDGQRIVTKPVAETQPVDLVTWMVGRELHEFFPKTEGQRGKPLLEVRHVNSGRLQDFNLTVHAGEVVGVFGLLGAGVHTIGRALFGDEPRTGDVLLDGKPIRPNSPTDAIDKGLGLLTENRREDGLLPFLSVQINVTLVCLQKFASAGWIRSRAEAQAAEEHVRKLSIKTPSLAQKIRLLSGGNQQKALMARWLLHSPRVLILAEPTRGIDVGSKVEIYRLIDHMAHQGMGVLVMSTELPEILGIADRIVVMYEGQITGQFSRTEATKERVIAAATGMNAPAAPLNSSPLRAGSPDGVVAA